MGYIVTLKKTDATVTEIAVWIRQATHQKYPLKDALFIATCILRGETWRPDVLDTESTELCTILEEQEADEFEQLSLQRKAQYDLLQRGANGDVVAAIEYCRLELAGKISHGPYA